MPGVATETLKGCARSVIADDDGDGPYGRQNGGGQGSEDQPGGRFSVSAMPCSMEAALPLSSSAGTDMGKLLGAGWRVVQLGCQRENLLHVRHRKEYGLVERVTFGFQRHLFVQK